MAMFDGVAANEERFSPPEFSDPEFQSWALRTALRLVNMPDDSTECDMRRVLVKEGTPSPAWAQALICIVELSRPNKCKAMTA